MISRVPKTLEEAPPNSFSVWDGPSPSLTAHLNASKDAVWRLLRKEGICLRLQGSWCIRPGIGSESGGCHRAVLESTGERDGVIGGRITQYPGTGTPYWLCQNEQWENCPGPQEHL